MSLICATVTAWKTMCLPFSPSDFENIWTVFRQFPDALDDDWTRAILQGRTEAQAFLRQIPDRADRFRLRYQSSLDDLDWEGCSAVLARQDIVDAMSQGW